MCRHDRERRLDHEISLQPILQRCQPQLPQPNPDDDRVLRLRHVGQRLTPPQDQRLAQPTPRTRSITGPQRQPPLADQPLEPAGVHRVRRQVELIPAVPRSHHPPVGKRLPQPPHQRLQRSQRVSRRLLRPQRIHQRIRGDRTANVHREPDQQRPQPHTTDLHHAVVGGHLQRPQHRHPHTTTLPRAMTQPSSDHVSDTRVQRTRSPARFPGAPPPRLDGLSESLPGIG